MRPQQYHTRSSCPSPFPYPCMLFFLFALGGRLMPPLCSVSTVPVNYVDVYGLDFWVMIIIEPPNDSCSWPCAEYRPNRLCDTHRFINCIFGDPVVSSFLCGLRKSYESTLPLRWTRTECSGWRWRKWAGRESSPGGGARGLCEEKVKTSMGYMVMS